MVARKPRLWHGPDGRVRNCREDTSSGSADRHRAGRARCWFAFAMVVGLFALAAPASAGEAPGAAETTDESEETTPTRRFNAEGEPLSSLLFSGTQKLDLIFMKIKQDTGITITAMGTAKGQSVPGPMLPNATVPEALKWIASQKDWVYWKEGPNEYIISDRAYYEKTKLKTQVVQRVIRPQNISAQDAEKAVTRMITPNVGTITSDARTNQVFVTDLLPVVEAIERTIRLLDQKVFVRVFTIKHANPQDVLTILQEYKSAPGRLNLVPKMRQIIAEDTYENIQRMEVMVDILDRGPEMKIYDLNNVDFEGKSLQDIEGYLTEEIITEGAYLKFDQQNAVMILIDLPSVHEKVQKILEAVDRPPRQVYIQAEIVETSFEHSFSIGTEWEVADDLLLKDAGGGTTGSAGGFVDLITQGRLRNEIYPVVKWGGGGATLDYLSRHARVTFTAVMSDSETRVLAQPRILVKNGESAQIRDGGSISYPGTSSYGGYGGGYGGGGGYPGSGQGGGYYNPYASSVNAQRVPTGVDLTVDPTITNNGLIQMRVTLANISGTTKESQLYGQAITLVDTTDQSLDSVLVIPDGQTRMIGGMIENRESESVGGVPYLKDIPLFGGVLFGKISRGPVRRRTLLMFITPSIVQEKARKYAEPIDDDEKTPPTLYEQASWSAAAVKRTIEEALGQIDEELPELPEIGLPPGEVPPPTVSLEHTPTTGSAEVEPPSFPVLIHEEPPTTGPDQLIPPAPDEPLKEPVEKPESIEPLIPSPPTPDTPAPLPDVEKEKLPEPPSFPSTGTALFSSGPPRVVLSGRRPGDLPEPQLPDLADSYEVPKPGPAVAGDVDLSSYEVVVMGEDGRFMPYLPDGRALGSPRLGMMKIPVDTLAAKATPARARRRVVRTPIRRTPVRRTPIRRPPARPTAKSITPPRPTPRVIFSPSRTPSRGSPGRVTPWGSPYGSRPPIVPPGYRRLR